MLELLSEKLDNAFRNLTGKATLNESNINDALRDVRRALLEADVNYQVVKKFIAEVKEECLGAKVLKSVKPGQQAIKVVHDHLVTLLGEANVPLSLTGQPAVIMLVGLHGGGKTTSAAKLAKRLKTRENKSLKLAACDLHRPAAIDQLEILGGQLDISVHSDRQAQNIAAVAGEARKAAASDGTDVLIVDTAGRHQIDEDLVEELVETKKRIQPCEILLVADSALGQEAVSVANHFDEALGITGLILTKLDGDARGGAALSMRQVTGQPIKFIGTGEGVDDFEPFHPDRLASRILGMGDIVGLVEKASEQYAEEESAKLEEKMRKSTFDLEDFQGQIRKLKRMGGLMSMIDLLPGAGKLKGKLPVDEKQINQVEAIIGSMTPKERTNPKLLNGSRRQRIARGSGVQTQDVNQLISRFEGMKKIMGGANGMENMQQMLGNMEQGGGMPGKLSAPGGMGGVPTMGPAKHGTKGTKKKKTKRRKNKKR